MKLQLKETRKGCHICETTPRYDVVLNGQTVGQLYFNMRGYVGLLPDADGTKLDIGEQPISRFKREVSLINKAFRRLS